MSGVQASATDWIADTAKGFKRFFPSLTDANIRPTVARGTGKEVKEVLDQLSSCVENERRAAGCSNSAAGNRRSYSARRARWSGLLAMSSRRGLTGVYDWTHLALCAARSLAAKK